MAAKAVKLFHGGHQVFLAEAILLEVMAGSTGRLDGGLDQHRRPMSCMGVMTTAALACLHRSMHHRESVYALVAGITTLRLRALEVFRRFATVGIVTAKTAALPDGGGMDGSLTGQVLVAICAEPLGVVLEQLGQGATMRQVTDPTFALFHRPVQKRLGQDFFVARATDADAVSLDQMGRGRGMRGVAGQAKPFPHGIVGIGILLGSSMAIRAKSVSLFIQDGWDGAGMRAMTGQALACRRRSMLAPARH